MLQNFAEQRAVTPNVHAQLLQYDSKKPYSLLALLFQTPYGVKITQMRLNQAILDLENSILENDLLESTSVEAWVELYFHQPTQIDVSNLLDELLKCCNQYLITDLIKLIYQYLDKNVWRLFLGMHLYVLDTDCRWEIAEIQHILWIPHKLEHFIYVHYPGYINKWNEWIPVTSARLKLMQSAQGQIVTTHSAINFQLLKPDDYVDYYDFRAAKWTSVQLLNVNIQLGPLWSLEFFYFGISTSVYESFAIRLAPHRTFT